MLIYLSVNYVQEENLCVYLWIEYECNMNWMNENLRIWWKLLRLCSIFGVEDINEYLGVFFTGSEELFSPFLADTLPNFL